MLRHRTSVNATTAHEDEVDRFLSACTIYASLIIEGRKSGKEKTYKHKQIAGIVPGLGGYQCFFLGGGSFLMGPITWGRKEHINKIPPIPGTP